MKKLVIFLLVSICTSIYGFSQARISSVYGVNLGDSEYSVISALESQGKTGKFKTNSKGEKYYSVSNPTLGICTFEVGNFVFDSSGDLERVVFVCSDNYLGIPSLSEQTNFHYTRCINSASKFQRIFNTMRSDLIDKYGTPNIDDEERAVWKSNGNLIELYYSFEEKQESWGNVQCDAFVRVTYRKDNNSSNF